MSTNTQTTFVEAPTQHMSYVFMVNVFQDLIEKHEPLKERKLLRLKET